MVLATFRDYGLGWDDYTHSEYGDLLVRLTKGEDAPLVPLAPDRTHIECTWSFAPESLARPDFDPAYAIEFWDITNRQDWHACESVQRGMSSPHAVPGPLSPEEDAVYQFVTMVARGYQGDRVWNTGITARVI